jgi:hypothetical protein
VGPGVSGEPTGHPEAEADQYGHVAFFLVRRLDGSEGQKLMESLDVVFLCILPLFYFLSFFFFFSRQRLGGQW